MELLLIHGVKNHNLNKNPRNPCKQYFAAPSESQTRLSIIIPLPSIFLQVNLFCKSLKYIQTSEQICNMYVKQHTVNIIYAHFCTQPLQMLKNNFQCIKRRNRKNKVWIPTSLLPYSKTMITVYVQ